MTLLEQINSNRVRRFLPERLTDIRSWQGHLPFAFWIIEVLQPDLFVELGTHKGDSYCGFCQAVRDLGLTTRCYSVDTWRGDDQAGCYDESVYEELLQYHQEKYSDFSRLLRMTFDEALDSFEDRSIDLLHIDGHHTYDEARHDFHAWLPKLSESGVVLIHDTQVYEKDFGVWRVFKELSMDYPAFEFYHSNGLGILKVGEGQKFGIEALFNLTRDEEERVRAFFRELGMKIVQPVTERRVGGSSQTIESRKDVADDEPIIVKKGGISRPPKVSVVIPAYNHEAFVLEAVRSVLDQTEPDIELIVIDDGSTDGTLERLTGIQDARVSIYTQRNQGAATTINRGLELARGNYFTILNSDDVYPPNRIEVLSRFLDENPDVDFIATYLTPIDKKGDSVEENTEIGKWLGWYRKAIKRADDDTDLLSSLLIRNYVVTTSNYFFRRTVFEQTPSFDNNLRYCHDYKFLLQAMRVHKFRLVREFLLKYRLHDANTISEDAFAKNLEILYVIFSTIDVDEFMALTDMEKRMNHPLAIALTENPVVNSEIVASDLKDSLERTTEWIVEKDRRIESAQRAIEGLQEHIRKYEHKLTEANNQAAGLRNMVNELNVRLIDLNDQLREKARVMNDQLREKDRVANELNVRLIGINDQLREKALELGESTKRLQEANEQRSAYKMEIDQKNRLLHEIFTSKGWKFLTRLRKLKRALDLRNKVNKSAALEPSGSYPVKPRQRPLEDRPVVIHIIANMMTGGSSRLVVDLIEYLGHLYHQEVITSLIPEPPAYTGFPCHQIIQPKSVEDVTALLKSKNTSILHIHYWGDCDEPWYRFFFEAAHKLSCKVIENINTPVAPFRDAVVDHYAYVSRYAMKFDPPTPENASVIYPGSDFSLFNRKGAKIPDDAIGMVYRLEPDKLQEDAIDIFIEVTKRRPRTKCYIIGGGTFLDIYRKRVASAGLSKNFTFTGYVSYKSLPKYYNKMSLFVAPVWKESFGQVSPFAMSMELPVTGYDVGALSEILGDDSCLGRSTEELADIICDLLDNRDKRLEIGGRNRERALELFSVETMITAYKELYGSLLHPVSLPRSEKLRILIPVHVFFPDHYFGTETYTLELATQLKTLGHEPVILTTTPKGEKGSGKLIDTYEYKGLPVYVIDLNLRPTTRFLDTYYRPELRPIFEEVIDRIQPDIVHVTHLINHSAAFLEVVKRKEIPAIATMTDFFGLCFNCKLEKFDGTLCIGPNPRSTSCLSCYLKVAQSYPFRDKIGGIIQNRAVRYLLSRSLPWLIRIPGFRKGAVAGHVQDVRSRTNILRRLYGVYTHLVAPSDFLYEAYEKNNFYPEKLTKINFGINIDSIRDYSAPKKNRDGIIRFGYIGQMMAHKGVDLLLEAFNRVAGDNKRLNLYGPAGQDPAYMDKLRNIAGKNGKIAFRNTFPREELAARLYEMDILAIPSRWYENSPLVLLYALATRTPVIVTDVKGMTEFVQHDVNGYVFEMNNAEQLAGIMQDIVRDPSRIERLSMNASYEMDILDHASHILELYEDALRKKEREKAN